MEQNNHFTNKDQKKDVNNNKKNTFTITSKKEFNNQLNNIKIKENKSNNLNINKQNEKIMHEKSDDEEIKKVNSIKGIKLQEKLKKIFLEREKAKYKYNKQIIPDQLKYNSEDEESNYSIKNQKSNKNEENKKSETIQNIIYKNIETIKIKKEKKYETKNDLINNKKLEIPNDDKDDKNDKNDKDDKLRNSKNINNNNGPEPDEFRQKYFKLLSTKTSDEIDKNKKEDINIQNKNIENKNIEKNSSEKNNDIEKKEIINDSDINCQKDNNTSLLSKSVGKIEVNNDNKELNNTDIINISNDQIKPKIDITPFKNSDINNKKNVLKLLELIKSKKSERELLVKKKDEIKRSRSMAVNRKKEKEKEKEKEETSKETKEDLNKELIKENKEKENNINNDKNKDNDNNNKSEEKHNNKNKPSLTSQKIYKKNPHNKIRVNQSSKANNFLTDLNNKLNKENDENKISLSPLNINNIESSENTNLLSATNKSSKLFFNNSLHSINKNNNENDISTSKNEKIIQNKFFYQTSNQIKSLKKYKYEKPKISISNNNIYHSTKYKNKSLSKNRIIYDYDTNNQNSKNQESFIYSPKKMKMKKIKSENKFKKQNKLGENNNSFYVKKKTLLNDNQNLSKSNYNIYSNLPNIHNFYNNSKIFLKNKFISIHPSFSINSINNNSNSNKNIEEIELNSNNTTKYNKSKDTIKDQKNNIKKIGSGNLNMIRKGKYIYQKNKINNKNINQINEKSFQDNILNESDNSGEIDDINYDYLNLRVGTEEMTYNNSNNIFKNAYLNLADSYTRLCPDNNTFYEPNDNNNNNASNIENYNHIYKNNNIKDNIFLNQSSTFFKKKKKRFNNINTINNINYKRNYKLSKNNSILINIENILIFEEKFNNIISYLKKNLSIVKPCLDLWNYYYNSWIYEKIEKIFNDEEDVEIIKLCINYLLLSIMICYYFSLKQEIFNNSNYLLYQILDINYNSIMLIFQQINNNVLPENQNNIFLPILTRIYINYIKKSNMDNNNLMIIEKIYNNNDKIDEKIKNILSRKNNEYFKILYNFSTGIRLKNNKEINDFFINYILNEENYNGSLFSSNYYITNSSFAPFKPPYLKSPNKKNFTLILDLNETLINFKYEENGEGYVRIRPFLFGFLEEVGQLYELIVFTSSEKDYADSVIEAIEKERTYFDHVFYRQHTIIVGNDFVKDLTRIGRPLNSTIIIDNMPQNFKLQKENGILIKPFWGEDSNDRTLYDLMPILLDIAKEGGDVRYGLNRYRNEIIGKISSNITKKKYDD